MVLKFRAGQNKDILEHCSGLIINNNSDPIGFCLWKKSLKTHTYRMYLGVSDVADNIYLVADFLIYEAFKTLTKSASITVYLKLLINSRIIKDLLIEKGFIPSNKEGTVYKKLAVGRIIAESNWPNFINEIKENFNIQLQEKPPRYTDNRQLLNIYFGRQEQKIPLEYVERYLSPILILLPNQNGLVIPIRKHFSEELLDTKQSLLFSSNTAHLSSKKIYYLDASRKDYFNKTGIPILFYESAKNKGSKSIIGIARFIKWYFAEEYDEKGVINQENISSITKRRNSTIAIEFDNYFMFDNYVSLAYLKKIGCVDGANFVTTTKIVYKHILKIISAGLK